MPQFALWFRGKRVVETSVTVTEFFEAELGKRTEWRFYNSWIN